jgi:hypothetical protein
MQPRPPEKANGAIDHSRRRDWNQMNRQQRRYMMRARFGPSRCNPRVFRKRQCTLGIKRTSTPEFVVSSMIIIALLKVA